MDIRQLQAQSPLAGFVAVFAAFLVPATIYLALGALGLSFAIAPGYASPIFPAAGFAVALLLWSDKRAWLAIWGGSVALNICVAWLHGGLDWNSGLIATGIATGSTLQALAARWLVLRSIRNGWQTLEVERDIVRCLLLAGPVACLVSASTGVTLLYMAQLLPASEYAYAWWNWWSGDTLGVLVVLPLSLTLRYRSRAPWRSRLTMLMVPMLVSLGLVGGAFYAVATWERSQQQQFISTHGETLARLLEQRFNAHKEALSALRRLLVVTPDMTYPQFEYFTRITLQDNPDIFALSINPYVLPAQREAFERSLAKKTGWAGVEIKERDSERGLVRAKDRPEYVAVGYIAPLEGNRPAVGYDINSEPVRHDAIQRAKRSGQPAITAPIRLVQENQARAGVLMLTPARSQPGTSLGAGANDSNLMGFAVGVIKVDQMVEIATRFALVEGLAFQVDDALSPPETSRLYLSQQTATKPVGAYAWQKQLAVADRTWTLTVFPTAAYLRQSHHWAALAVGAAGLALAALLQVLLLITTGRTEIVQRKVQLQTAELQVKSDALEDKNAQLEALFALSPGGFVAFAPDGTVKFVNPAFLNMTGIELAEVIGKDTEAFDSALRKQCEHAGEFAGVSSYFERAEVVLPQHILTLAMPHHAVLQIKGMRSESSSVSRILYLHDITREAEVDRLKSEFLSHAAHELRTPMTSIFGFSEVLLEIDLDEATQRDLLQTIHRQTKWLVDIVNELLDLSRIDSLRGKDLKIEQVDLAALVRDTAANQVLSAKHQLNLVLPEGPMHAMADVAKLRQALLNVLSNACKYSPEGSEIRLALLDAPLRKGIEISDHGIGMTPQQLTHFGERFWRADTSGKAPGTGLGLAIVKEIFKLLGGSIEVRSQPDAGTTVTLWLPVANA